MFKIKIIMIVFGALLVGCSTSAPEQENQGQNPDD